jgi:hypothetical protein
MTRSDVRLKYVHAKLSAHLIPLIATFFCYNDSVSCSPFGFLQVAVFAVMFTVLVFFGGREDVGKTAAACVPSQFNWVVVLAIKSWLNRPEQVVRKKKN